MAKESPPKRSCPFLLLVGVSDCEACRNESECTVSNGNGAGKGWPADEAVGTIWAIMHRGRGNFDAEDERVMTSLEKFASFESLLWSVGQAGRSAVKGQNQQSV